VKNKKTNQGFAHLMIVVIILAIGLVGAIGYIVYLNINHNKTSSSVNSSNSSSTSNDSSTNSGSNTTNSSSTKYLTINNGSDWDVKFQIPENATDEEISFSQGNGNYNGYGFSTTRIRAIGDCANYAGVGGFIYKTIGPDNTSWKNGDLITNFDGNYYYYTAPITECAAGNTVFTQEVALIKQLIDSVQKN
jgi:hypothetical protein